MGADEAEEQEDALLDAPLTAEDVRILWANVLLKAVEDFKNGVRTQTTEGRRSYTKAKSWIWSDNEEFPSFLFLCEYLGIGARQVRRALHGYELQQRGQAERSGAGIVRTKLRSEGRSGDEGRRGPLVCAEATHGESPDCGS